MLCSSHLTEPRLVSIQNLYLSRFFNFREFVPLKKEEVGESCAGRKRISFIYSKLFVLFFLKAVNLCKLVCEFYCETCFDISDEETF